MSTVWESEFSFPPKKSRGNQRLYVQRDVDTVLEIKRMSMRHTLAGEAVLGSARTGNGQEKWVVERAGSSVFVVISMIIRLIDSH